MYYFNSPEYLTAVKLRDNFSSFIIFLFYFFQIRDLVRSRVDGATPVLVRPTVASADAPRGADPPPSAPTSASAHEANTANVAAPASSEGSETRPAATAASADSPQPVQATPASHVTSVAELLSWAT
jgi:hypothetical protein